MINSCDKKKLTQVFSTSYIEENFLFLHCWDLRCCRKLLISDQKIVEWFCTAQQNLQKNLDFFLKISAVSWKCCIELVAFLEFTEFSQTDEESEKSSSFFLSVIVYEVSFHHVRNISTFSESFNEYSTYWLSDDWERLIENSSALSMMKSFETADTADSASLLSSSDVSEADEKFEKLIDNDNLTYQQRIVKMIKI